MLASFSEFKFFQSFRLPVEKADNLRFLAEKEDEFGKNQYIDDAKLIDISTTGLGFSTMERLSVGTELTLSLQFKKNHLDLTGRVVRAFTNHIEDNEIIYGVEIDEEPKITRFLQQFIMSFSVDRLKECLINSALKERYTKASDGFEMFSLLLSLFKDITHFGDKEGFLENMLEEVVRVLNAQRSSVFLINPETNELESIAALGIDKENKIKFDYRVGIAGSVFTTGVALNIDTQRDQTRFNDSFDKKFNFETKSIICHPIHNREDKIIGVIEVINKRNEDRFTVEDEKTMKVLALVFSSVFHNFNPMSEKSQIRRFSTPFDRKFALIGKTPHVGSLRGAILRIKDLDTPVLIQGEKGVGKTLYSKIIHHEGQRGLSPCLEVDCQVNDLEFLASQLWNASEDESLFVKCKGGSLIFRNIDKLPLSFQRKLLTVLEAGGIPGGKVTFDVRIIATSSTDLSLAVDNGSFYQPLFEHLNKTFIYIEPLRRRMSDFEMLTEYFLKLECKKQGLLLKNISPKMFKKLKEYDWPGNIKELKQMIERAVLYNPKSHVISDIEFENSASPLVDNSTKKRMFGDLPYVSDFKIDLKDRVSLIEREMILSEIKRCNGNKSKAAKEMGISREALRKKLLQSDKILESLSENKEVEQKDAA